MSVITTSQSPPVTFDSMAAANYQQHYAASMEDIPPRSPSISSYSSNYSHHSSSTATTAYSVASPTSPKSPSYRFFRQNTPPQSLQQQQQQLLEPAIRRMPVAVYGCILNQLQNLHEGSGSYQYGCTTCFQRDLHALALTSRSWERAVRSKLYNHIHILGADSPSQLKKFRLKRGSRLKLLRRTLRERKLLANLVLELRVPEFDLLPTVNGKINPQWEEYRDLIASVVMVCPNLENLVGFHMSFHHEFDRLTYALSTRKRLREHKWLLGEPVDASAERSRSGSPPKTKLLDQQQSFEFLDYHMSWGNLETLMLHSLNSTGSLEHGIFLRIFNRLPSLQHLCISSFDNDSFTDRTLQFLPSLTSLRLEKLRGVTDTGIAQYVSRPEARSLKSLSLIEQNIGSLLAVSKLFASLHNLERFSIVQSTGTPSLPSGGMIFQPILASASLKYLHWDVVGPESAAGLGRLDSLPFVFPHKPSNSPNYHLAQSILHSGFPRLGDLRAPSDIEPPGILQSVCRPVPRGQALIPSDRYSLPRSSHGSVSIRPMALPAGNNLTSARIRAQTFIDMAAKDSETGIKVLVTDYSDSYVPDSIVESPSDDESVAESDLFGGSSPFGANVQCANAEENSEFPRKMYEFRMPAVMGILKGSTDPEDASIPRFILRPDLPGADSDGGLLGWKHLLSSDLSTAQASSTEHLKRSGSDLSMEQPMSPAATSRFAGWSGFGGRSSSAASVATPASPPTPITFSSTTNPPWVRDTCNGAWNSGRPKDWWMHFERERHTSSDIIETKRFF
ncbi:hypothetical protein BGW36DRAFT_361084 [Talaromyces proteolyticus]|uniref:F-box domain-containing protein n=1 Tax=Talaromyces proteolyticus TaxID=1131652 RepID=A0AAD4KS86_9EURO|nr:uncharacterized protein BGW36DRAFT_361084 [Talaromyces proteolyticus]KAH8695387.1 hypothetical protein BGW36DRAFT_361084 [Talaromyces proteolyticus]